MDLVIKNGLVVTPQGVINGGVAIEGERILQVGTGSSLPQAKQEVDAGGMIIFPGIIDPHHHLGLGPPRDWDKFERDMADETVACAVGGVTTVVTTMGGQVPLGQDVFEILDRDKQVSMDNSLVDFKLTPAIFTDDLIDQIPRLVTEHGVCSFKFPLLYTGPEGKHFGITWFDWGLVYKGFEKIAEVGLPALPMIHAEESAIIEVLKERLKGEGRTDLRAWSESRPNITETMHVFVCGLMAMHLGCPLYVVHVSAKESVDAIAWFKGKGVRVYGETTPHYLAPITMDDDLGTIGVVNPPLRTREDAERLWQGLADSTLDTMGSDHCGYERREDKEAGGLWECIVGFPGTGAILPIMMQGVREGRISLERMAKVCCENTARIFAMYPKKGALVPGADADILIIDPDKEWSMGVATMKGHSDWSVWEGRQAKGKAVKTYIRGKLVQEDGELVIDKPHGKFVEPLSANLGVPAVLL
jgi:dihydropyrimidinase